MRKALIIDCHGHYTTEPKAQREKIYSGNALEVYPRLAARLGKRR